MHTICVHIPILMLAQSVAIKQAYLNKFSEMWQNYRQKQKQRGTNQPQCESAKVNPVRILTLVKARKKDPPVKKGAL